MNFKLKQTFKVFLTLILNKELGNLFFFAFVAFVLKLFQVIPSLHKSRKVYVCYLCLCFCKHAVCHIHTQELMARVNFITLNNSTYLSTHNLHTKKENNENKKKNTKKNTFLVWQFSLHHGSIKYILYQCV